MGEGREGVWGAFYRTIFGAFVLFFFVGGGVNTVLFV